MDLGSTRGAQVEGFELVISKLELDLNLDSTREVDLSEGRGSTEASFELVISNLELDLDWDATPKVESRE